MGLCPPIGENQDFLTSDEESGRDLYIGKKSETLPKQNSK
jgi:hypothetical protein